MPAVSETSTTCFVCKGPWHPATGGLHWVEFSKRFVAWCGPCEHDFVKWFVRHQHARIRRHKAPGGKTVVLRFYDYAFPLLDKADET
jgi:hypothetical protein